MYSPGPCPHILHSPPPAHLMPQQAARTLATIATAAYPHCPVILAVLPSATATATAQNRILSHALSHALCHCTSDCVTVTLLARSMCQMPTFPDPRSPNGTWRATSICVFCAMRLTKGLLSESPLLGVLMVGLVGVWIQMSTETEM